MDDRTPKGCEVSMDVLAGMFAALMANVRGGFSKREGAALGIANELVRRWTERDLGAMAGCYDDEILVDGKPYKRHSSGVRRYHSLAGAVEVKRYVYRRTGIHNGPTVVPLELEAGIIENATPALAASVLQGFTAMPLRQYEEEMNAAHRHVPSRSTLERIGKRIGAMIRDEVPMIEPVVRAREHLTARARSISIGLDRTTIPMSEPSGEPVGPPRGHVRRRPLPCVVAYRMAYVGTIAVNDRNGDLLTSLRFSATAAEGPAVLLERLAAELRHMLDQAPRLPVVVIQDGAPELWALVDECLENLGVKPAMRLIDRYHLETRLAAMCEAIERDAAKARALFDHWRRLLDRTDLTMRRICSKLKRLLYGKFDDELTPFPTVGPRLFGVRASVVREHLTYFANCQDRTNYAMARARRLPIGSGVTEGACKSVVASRFKRSGQRWIEQGASACLHVRTLHLNSRLRPIFEIFVDERARSLN